MAAPAAPEFSFQGMGPSQRDRLSRIFYTIYIQPHDAPNGSRYPITPELCKRLAAAMRPLQTYALSTTDGVVFVRRQPSGEGLEVLPVIIGNACASVDALVASTTPHIQALLANDGCAVPVTSGRVCQFLVCRGLGLWVSVLAALEITRVCNPTRRPGLRIAVEAFGAESYPVIRAEACVVPAGAEIAPHEIPCHAETGGEHLWFAFPRVKVRVKVRDCPRPNAVLVPVVAKGRGVEIVDPLDFMRAMRAGSGPVFEGLCAMFATSGRRDPRITRMREGADEPADDDDAGGADPDPEVAAADRGVSISHPL